MDPDPSQYRHRQADGEPHRRIAVLVSAAATDQLAIRQAAAAALEHHARLTLVQIIPRPCFTVHFAGVAAADLLREALDEAERDLRRRASALPPGVGCTLVVRCGRRLPELVRVLEAGNHDALYLGARHGALTAPAHSRFTLACRLGIAVVVWGHSGPVEVPIAATTTRTRVKPVPA